MRLQITGGGLPVFRPFSPFQRQRTHLRKRLPPAIRDHSGFRSVSNKRRRQAAIHKSGPPGPDNRLPEGKPVIARGGVKTSKGAAIAKSGGTLGNGALPKLEGHRSDIKKFELRMRNAEIRMPIFECRTACHPLTKTPATCYP